MTDASLPHPGSDTHHEEDKGFLAWVATVDHKRIGIMYLLVALFYLIVGGIEALLIRTQLMSPGNDFLSPGAYNEVFTMHGTTMIFMVVMPAIFGVGNYIIPLQLGCRDVAFPRLNAFSFWLLPFGSILMHYAWVTNDAPSAGWFAYAPLSTRPYNTMYGMSYWCVALLAMGVGSVAASINLLVTIFVYRAKGMSFGRLPLFTLMMGVVTFLVIVAIPALNTGLLMLLSDRWLETHFFLAQPGRMGDPVFWQHLFWIFGHPEVYILAVPAFGIISEVVPVFSRKPIFGYAFAAAASLAIGTLGLIVWAHHMFVVGLGRGYDIYFMAATFAIAVPTGIKVFNWAATMIGGKLQMKTPLYYSIAFIFQFVLSGLTGIMLATLPFDWAVSDSYFVVAHFHYVAIGGILFAFMAGFHYWLPKMSGKMMNDRWGKLEFWLLVIGFNVTFGIQHFLGFLGMARRTYTYADFPGYHWMNFVSTIGAYIIGAGVVVFAVNLTMSLWKGKPAGNNPWGGFTLEWLTTSPPPHDNFKKVPLIKDRRPVWGLDHPELADWKTEKSPADNGKRGDRLKHSVMFLILSESVMFFLLLVGHILYQNDYDGPPTQDILDVSRMWFFSITLWASSGTLFFAERALRKGVKKHFLGWLGLTILMGVAFIVGSVIEYTGLLSGGFDMQTNQFGATFYMITGMHCIHVCVGLTALVIMWILGTRKTGALTKKRENRMVAAGYYWHFVDAIWIFVFGILYLGIIT